jgi:spectinomycin phosphotransferase
MSELTKQDLARALQTHYAIDAKTIEPTEAGQDATAQRYRVDSRYFVKVRPAADAREAAAALSRHLFDEGVPHVVAPLRSQGGSLTVRDGEHSLTVYPLVDGVNGMQSGLTEQQWRAFGSFVGELHATSLPRELTIASETYRPAELDTLPRIDDAVSRSGTDDATAFWMEHRDEIFALATRTEALGRELEQLTLPFVLCHSDLHTNNVMIDRDGGLWVIDWDEPTNAPKERDLMFVVGGIHTKLVKPHETAWFLEGYGDPAVDPLALAYYRRAWALQDIGLYGAQAYLKGSSVAFEFFRRLFAPGAIVEIARNSS